MVFSKKSIEHWSPRVLLPLSTEYGRPGRDRKSGQEKYSEQLKRDEGMTVHKV